MCGFCRAVGFFPLKAEGECVIFQHASCKVLADRCTSLPQNREVWGFSYYAVIWKVLEHFIAILKISLKLKANQLPKHTCSSKMFLQVSLKQLKKFSTAL